VELSITDFYPKSNPAATIPPHNPDSHEHRPETMTDWRETSMSVTFFRNDRILCMFDPETFKLYLNQHGSWVESDDPKLREDIRFSSVELSREEARRALAGESLTSA
jgi:hypothetical protein